MAKVAEELRVVDAESPMLVFGEDGRKIEAHASLPRDAVWVLHPDDGELVADEPIRVIVEGQLPLGWSGWRLRQVSLDGVPSIALAGHPATADLACQGRAVAEPDDVGDVS